MRNTPEAMDGILRAYFHKSKPVLELRADKADCSFKCEARDFSSVCEESVHLEMSEKPGKPARPSKACPEPWVIADYAAGTLDKASEESVAGHLETCPDCTALVSDAQKTLSAGTC